jgi:hypothetical protein
MPGFSTDYLLTASLIGQLGTIFSKTFFGELWREFKQPHCILNS